MRIHYAQNESVGPYYEKELNQYAKKTVAQMLRDTYKVPFGELMRFDSTWLMEEYAKKFGGRPDKPNLSIVRGDCLSCGAPLETNECGYCGRLT